MTTIGYKNIPFTVHVVMHAAIHAEHYVNLNNGGDGRMTFPSGNTQMMFSPLNWATPQDVVINFNGVGDAELLADITNDYFVNGKGEHRSKRFIIDLSVTELPLDTWAGSVPGLLVGGDHGGTLQISHRALDATHSANVAITVIDGVLNGTSFQSHQAIMRVIKPDGSTVDLSNSNNVGISMDQVGIWTFQVGAAPACIVEGAPGSLPIQRSTWTFSTTDGVSGVVTPATKHQGASYYGQQGSLPILPNGAFNLAALTMDENTAASTPALIAGTCSTQLNCTGASMVSTGTAMTISGTRINAPSGMSAGGTDASVQIDGVTISGISASVGAF